MSRWQDIPVLRSLAELLPPDKVHDVLYELEDCVSGCEDGVDDVLEAIDCLRDDKTYEALIADLQSKNQNNNGGVELMRHFNAVATNIHRSQQSYQLAKELSSYGSNVVSLSMRLPDLTADDPSQMENCTAWGEFVQKSNLKKMHMFWDNYAIARWESPGDQDIPSLGTSLFKAMADCKGLEVVKHSGRNKLPMKFFATFLSVAKIRRLNVCSSVLDELDFGSFAEALGYSQTLETVDLQIDHEKEASLLPQLAKIPCLKEVNLSFGPVNELEYRVYLVRLLEQSTALCRLTLTGVCFSRELMEALTMVLAGRPGMTKLTLEQCNYPDGSDFELVKYLQKTNSLEEFGFGRHSSDDAPESGLFSLEAWAKLLFESSALQAVRFTQAHDADSDPIHWLQANAAMIQVKALRFDFFYDIPTWLLTCIERFRHVRNLQVVFEGSPPSMLPVVFKDISRVVKNNTSLRSISMLKEHGWDDERLCPLLTCSQEDALAAYCQRNECLPALLASHDGDSVFPLLLAHVGNVRPNPALVFLQGSSDLCVHHDRVAASSASFESRRDKKRTLPVPV